jgi:hypothetical protein
VHHGFQQTVPGTVRILHYVEVGTCYAQILFTPLPRRPRFSNSSSKPNPFDDSEPAAVGSRRYYNIAAIHQFINPSITGVSLMHPASLLSRRMNCIEWLSNYFLCGQDGRSDRSIDRLIDLLEVDTV